MKTKALIQSPIVHSPSVVVEAGTPTSAAAKVAVDSGKTQTPLSPRGSVTATNPNNVVASQLAVKASGPAPTPVEEAARELRDLSTAFQELGTKLGAAQRTTSWATITTT